MEVELFICTKTYHPSGNPTPSPQDIQFTKRMEECGEMMGIQLLDHIIVGDSGYISLREENFCFRMRTILAKIFYHVK